MDKKPNVTVIYQDAKPSTPGFGAVLLEVVVFVAILTGVALLAGGGCAW